MTITFVKKIKQDGSPCRKCAEVQARLEKEGYIDNIDRTVIADERDSTSEGMELAKKFNVSQAPFFIVEEENEEPKIFTIYFKFVNEILSGKTSDEEEAQDILDANQTRPVRPAGKLSRGGFPARRADADIGTDIVPSEFAKPNDQRLVQ